MCLFICPLPPVDTRIPDSLEGLVVRGLQMFTQMVALVIFTPVFILPAIVLTMLGKLCGDLFTRAVLCVRRELSNAKAPVLAQFEGAVSGIVSIRAYAVQDTMERELRRRVDENVRITRTFANIGRWMPTRVEFLGALFSSCLAGYLVYFSGVDAATAGFSLNMAVTFTGGILFFIFLLNDLEIEVSNA
ncbi:hypothetical protein PM082_015428 [Marasmius tenuissimus]|nr:hypothetical protein PM082_015428 [Marasmius tenuissimus]